MNTKKRKIGEVSGGVELVPVRRGRKKGTVAEMIQYLEQSIKVKLKTPIHKKQRFQGSFHREPVTLAKEQIIVFLRHRSLS